MTNFIFSHAEGRLRTRRPWRSSSDLSFQGHWRSTHHYRWGFYWPSIFASPEMWKYYEIFYEISFIYIHLIFRDEISSSSYFPYIRLRLETEKKRLDHPWSYVPFLGRLSPGTTGQNLLVISFIDENDVSSSLEHGW